MRYDRTASEDHDTGNIARQVMAIALSEGLDLHSILVRQRGAVIGEAYSAPFDAETPHRMHSVTKSFVSTAIGIAVAEGRLTVEDRVVDLFPHYLPDARDPHRNAIRVKHLLTMSSGHLQPLFPPLSRPAPTLAGFLASTPVVPPGSRFDYSNFCSYTLAAIVERLSGETLGAYLKPRILEPLGIELRDWLRTEEGVTNGGWGLHLTTRELARFGQLYLDRGVWQGAQLVPADWIAEATGKRIESWNHAGNTDWRRGYGYQFWRSAHGYRMDGLMGQFALVLEDLDALVVTTAGTLRTQRLLELVWENIVPALGGTTPARIPGPPAAEQPRRTSTSPRSPEISGTPFRLGEPIVLPTRLYGGQVPIVSFGIEIDGESLSLVATDRNAGYRLSVGIADWAEGVTPFCTGYPEPYRARAGWETGSRLVVDLVFTEAGLRMKFVFDVDPAQLTVTLPANPGLESRMLICRPFP